MLRLSRKDRKLQRLDRPTLAQAEIFERADLQEYIWNSSSDFFAELGEELFLIGKEVCPSENVGDRIDLLAVDADGNVVVIELKRGNDKLQLLQSIAYAGMVAKWTAEDILAQAGTRADDLREFVQEEMLNRAQRVLLIAEAYDYEVLVGAEWLYEQYGVPVSCARVAISRDPVAQSEYISCIRIFPTTELADHALVRGTRRIAAASEGSWETLIASMTNPAFQAFIKTELANGQESRWTTRSLFYRLNGHRRYMLEVRRPHGTVWTLARHSGDISFWQSRLSDPLNVVERGNGRQIRFFLRTSQDCAAFKAALPELAATDWGEEIAAPATAGS